MNDVLITRGRVEVVAASLYDPALRQEASAELRKMLDVKQALLQQSAGASCCSAFFGIRRQLEDEVLLLEAAVAALDQGNIPKAALSLREYGIILEGPR